MKVWPEKMIGTLTHKYIDRDPGEKLNLARLQEAVRADPALQNMSAKEEEDLINEYKEARAVKKAGVRINNQAANLDYQSTVTRVESEVMTFFDLFTCRG